MAINPIRIILPNNFDVMIDSIAANASPIYNITSVI